MAQTSQYEINANNPIRSKNSTLSTSALFEARKFYNDRTLQFISGTYFQTEAPDSTITNIPFVDLYRENSFFGIVDLAGDVVIPKNGNTLKLVNISDDEPQKLQDFVADAFNDMKKYLDEQVLIGNFNSESPYVNLQIKKSFIDLDVLYPSNFIVLASKFQAYVSFNNKLNSKITDEAKFFEEFNKFLKLDIDSTPVTKTATTKSYNFTGFSSGLVLSLSDSDAGDDLKKYSDFFLDESFICFAEACVRFGFRIDKNNPWILTADLQSPAMRPYFDKYGLLGIEDLFNKRYKKVHLEDLESLKLVFFNSYNIFLTDNQAYEVQSNNSSCNSKPKYIIREFIKLSDKEIFKKYPDTFWMRRYIYYRILENKRYMTQQQFENLVREANNLVRYKQIEAALNFVNNRFNSLKESNYFSSLHGNKDLLKLESDGVPPDRAPEITL